MSVTDWGRLVAVMTDPAVDTRERLEKAALEMFRERGFDATSAADVAAKVGVTERTFFRYFPDKRDVLFGGGTLLQDFLASASARRPSWRRSMRYQPRSRRPPSFSSTGDRWQRCAAT